MPNTVNRFSDEDEGDGIADPAEREAIETHRAETAAGCDSGMHGEDCLSPQGMSTDDTLAIGPGVYRMRNGEAVRVTGKDTLNTNYKWTGITADKGIYCWTATGRSLFDGIEAAHDLVERVCD